MRKVLFALFLALIAAPAAAQDCDFLDTVWESELNDYRRVLYFDAVGSPNHHSVVVEVFSGETLELRVHGTLIYNNYGPEVGSIAILESYVPSTEGGQFVGNELRVSDAFIDIERLREGGGDSGWLVLDGLSAQIALLDSAYRRFFSPAGLQADAFRKAGCREGPLEFALVEDDLGAPCAWTRGTVYVGDDSSFGISTCTKDKSRAYLALSCAVEDGGIEIQYELAKGFTGAVSEGGPIDVKFSTDTGSWVLRMAGNDMDGTHMALIGRGNPLVELLASSSTLTISDEGRNYPTREVSLEGSADAVGALLRRCAAQSG